MRWPRGTRRLARILAVTLAALVGLLLLVVVLLFVRPLREEALDHVLQAASDALPGEISVERAGSRA